MPRIPGSVAVVVAAAFVFALMSYWGVRSPDGEVMFRTADSLAREAAFAVEPMELWPEFGVARGRDGRSYGKYGPAVPLLAAPLAWLGRRIEGGAGSPRAAALAPSQWLPDGFHAFREGRAPRPPDGHLIRSVAAALNVIVAALAVLAFFHLLGRLPVGPTARILACAGLAFGTPLLAHAGTLFSEPLIALALVRALDRLVAVDPRFGATDGAPCCPFLRSGLWLGLGVAAHPTVALWVLPFAVYAWSIAPALRAKKIGQFALGLAPFALGLLWLNAARFGNPLTTGRPDADFDFVAPWANAGPFFLAWGKGILVWCPIAMAGLIGLPLLAKRNALLAWLISGGTLMRGAVFLSFHDWHGGFGPGPRYLLPEVALLLVPAALLVERVRARPVGLVTATAAVCLCATQQAWLASGEVFSWWQQWRLMFEAEGANPFAGDLLYREWKLSPFASSYLTDAPPGPALARALGWGGIATWLLAALGICSLTIAGVWSGPAQE